MKNRDHGRSPSLKRKPQASNGANIVAKDGGKGQQAKKNEVAVRPNKPAISDSGPGRPPKSTMQKKGSIEPKVQQNTVKNTIPKNPHVRQLDVRKSFLGSSSFWI